MILCAGPFPALQRTLRLTRLDVGAVNRAAGARLSAAGKPVNAARAVLALGGMARVTGFRGGETGNRLMQCLRAERIPFRFTDAQIPTRICQTLLETAASTATELVEESAMPDPRAWQAWFRLVRGLLPGARMLILSGTLPAGAPPDTWLTLTRHAHGLGVPVIIDSHGEPLLRALEARPWLVKPNASELARTLALPKTGLREIREGMRRLREAGARNVLVTHGARPVLLQGEAEAWRILPAKTPCLNPIGCGDTLAGVLALGHVRGLDLPEAARQAVAAATARCRMAEPGAPGPEAVAEWTGKTAVELSPGRSGRSRR